MYKLTQIFTFWLIGSLLFFASPLLYAQSWQHSRQIGTQSTQSLSALLKHKDKLFVALAFQDQLHLDGKILSSKGEEDIALLLLEKDKAPQSLLVGGSSRGDLISDLKVDEAGNLIIIGSFWGQIDFGAFSLSSSDSPKANFLIKVDSSGQLIWSQLFLGGSLKEISGLDLDQTGNILLGGYFSENLEFADTTFMSPAASTSFVAKFDKDGQLLWANSFGEVGNNRVIALDTDEEERVVLSGYYDDTLHIGATKLIANTDDRDVFLMSYDHSGQLLWTRKAGGVFEEETTALEIDPSGNIYLTGQLTGVMVLNDSLRIQSRDGNTDLFLAKYDKEGSALWAKSIGGNQSQFVYDLILDSGQIWICGAFQANIFADQLSLETNNRFDGFLASFSFDGETQGLYQLPGKEGSILPTHLSANTKSPWIGGDFSGNLVLDDFEGTTTGNNFHIFLTQFEALISSINEKEVLSNLQLFPNPMGDTLFIKNDQKDFTISIIDAQGKRFYSNERLPEKINVKNWPKGMYFVFIVGEGEVMHSYVLIK